MGWTLTCEDAGDGSGDVIVELPDDLLAASGWAEGDTLELEPDPSDSSVIRITRRVSCDVCDANTAETGHGVLQAQWHDGEVESMRLCKSCFGYAMATLREAHRAHHMFEDEEQDQQATKGPPQS